METEKLILALILVFIAGILVVTTLRLIFKHSIVFNVGLVYTSAIAVIADFGIFVGARGFYHLSWAIPISVIIVFYITYLLKPWVRVPLRNLTDKIVQVSKGSINVQFSEEMQRRKDEVGDMSTAMNKHVEILNGIVTDITTMSNHLSSASSQLNSGSVQLSEGANEQASSVEEVSSSIEEIINTIKQNSDNAKNTEQIANDAAEGIRNGNSSVQETLKKMQAIASEIIIISDIAFQTNILALNAAVEAARAGANGKGFAVVASEVRKLAEKSKAAAEKINNITKDGVVIAGNAGDKLSTLVPRIEQTAGLVQEITAASIEQNSTILDVSNAIQQLGTISQRNAATSEQFSSNAQELTAQAEMLMNKIRFFKQ